MQSRTDKQEISNSRLLATGLISLPVGGFWMVQTLENQYPLTQIVNFSEYIIRDEKDEF